MALSIQKKFRWEISEILSAQWNSTFEFRLHRPGTQATARLVIVLVNRIQKSGAGGQQFCQMEREISVRPTRNDQTRSKRTTLKAGPEYSGRTKPKWSVPFDWHQLKFPEFWVECKASKHNGQFLRK